MTEGKTYTYDVGTCISVVFNKNQNGCSKACIKCVVGEHICGNKSEMFPANIKTNGMEKVHTENYAGYKIIIMITMFRGLGCGMEEVNS